MNTREQNSVVKKKIAKYGKCYVEINGIVYVINNLKPLRNNDYKIINKYQPLTHKPKRKIFNELKQFGISQVEEVIK